VTLTNKIGKITDDEGQFKFVPVKEFLNLPVINEWNQNTWPELQRMAAMHNTRYVVSHQNWAVQKAYENSSTARQNSSGTVTMEELEAAIDAANVVARMMVRVYPDVSHPGRVASRAARKALNDALLDLEYGPKPPPEVMAALRVKRNPGSTDDKVAAILASWDPSTLPHIVGDAFKMRVLAWAKSNGRDPSDVATTEIEEQYSKGITSEENEKDYFVEIARRYVLLNAEGREFTDANINVFSLKPEKQSSIHDDKIKKLAEAAWRNAPSYDISIFHKGSFWKALPYRVSFDFAFYTDKQREAAENTARAAWNATTPGSWSAAVRTAQASLPANLAKDAALFAGMIISQGLPVTAEATAKIASRVKAIEDKAKEVRHYTTMMPYDSQSAILESQRYEQHKRDVKHLKTKEDELNWLISTAEKGMKRFQ
jgi:hypothetical protein